MAENVITLNNVDVFQQKHLVLSNVKLDVTKGEFVFLIGATGSGKSSLLKIIYGDLHIGNGEGSVANFDLKNLKEKDVPFLRRKLGIVFQDFQLFPDRSVAENILKFSPNSGKIDKYKNLFPFGIFIFISKNFKFIRAYITNFFNDYVVQLMFGFTIFFKHIGDVVFEQRCFNVQLWNAPNSTIKNNKKRKNYNVFKCFHIVK